jgi:cytochrome c biogenesis protein CcmG, thiol:disulfide interchange protein DsbE
VVRAYNEYKDSELVFLTVSIAENPDPEYMRKIASVNNLPFPILIDPDWKVASVYNVTIPETFFIDRQGVIRGKFSGAGTLAEFKKGIAGIMAK